MVVGNLGALRQTNLKRLLAYSAIANAGYLLVGVMAFTAEGNISVIFYILVYSLASLGAFGVIAVLPALWRFWYSCYRLPASRRWPVSSENFISSLPLSEPCRKPPLGMTDFIGLSPSPS